VILDYTTCLGVSKQDDPSNELFYDELKMMTSTKVEIKDNVFNLTSFKTKFGDKNQYNIRSLPLRNKININKKEYRDFLKEMGFFTYFIKH
jgi:uncharacterized protein YdiU (UPF0061 family)